MVQEIEETRWKIFKRDKYKCRRCGVSGVPLHLAHGIAQSKANAKMVRRLFNKMYNYDITLKQAWEIIHSEFNLFSACSLECNSSFNFANKPEEVKRFLIFYHEGVYIWQKRKN